ncbi:hypothetical protein [Defluviimonas sp. SAOS-178_SWC]|uniref:hypothetical protein n=1 Tax=Defluviimonas sp. SAOS-178_SWC TaxID=3121287 RepID=UPI0032219C66
MVREILLSASCAALLGTAAVAGPCFEAVEAMNFALQGLPDEGVTAISLKAEGETRYVLFVAFEAKRDGGPNNNTASWRLIERQKESLTYCLAGAGRSLEVLESLHAIPGFDAEFGLPGSSKRRCNDEADGPLGSVAVRAWANKELGPSMVQVFGEPFRGDAFTVLLAEEGVQGSYPWILLQTRETRNCYYARGDDSWFATNFKMRADLKQNPDTLSPLE